MSEIQISNGSVVEDTLNDETEASITPEAYATLRYLKNEQGNLRNEIRDTQRAKRDDDSYTLPDDSDVVQYHEFLKSFKIEGQSLGKLQRVACGYYGDDYFANHNLGDALDLAPANETEQQIADKLLSERNNRDKATTKHFEQHMVPLTPDKEEMPLYVTSNDRNDGTHTFEEAKEMWDSFKSLISIKTTGGPVESDDEKDDEPTDDSDSSDQPSVNDPTNIKGVGSATIETLQEGGFEVVPSDVSKIEVEPFAFEEDDEKATAELPEVTSADVRDRYLEVKDDMIDMEQKLVEQRLIDGELMDAVDFIEDFE